MYYTLEELVDQYIARKVLVSIKELEEEGLLQEFCDRVEKIVPSRNGAYTHKGLYDYHIEHGVQPRKYYFKLHRGSRGSRFCTIEFADFSDDIAHLVNYDTSPADMEELLKM